DPNRPRLRLQVHRQGSSSIRGPWNTIVNELHEEDQRRPSPTRKERFFFFDRSRQPQPALCRARMALLPEGNRLPGAKGIRRCDPSGPHGSQAVRFFGSGHARLARLPNGQQPGARLVAALTPTSPIAKGSDERVSRRNGSGKRPEGGDGIEGGR